MSGAVSMCSRRLSTIFRIKPLFQSPFLHRNEKGLVAVKTIVTASYATNNNHLKPPTLENPGLDESCVTEESRTEPKEREKELLEKNRQLSQSISEMEDKYKRALAENENIRQRMRREISDAKQYSIQNFVKDLVEVADVLGKAVETVPKEAIGDQNPHLKNLFQGLQMTEAQLHSVFRRYGVTQVNPIGEKFNPNIHEALFEQEDASKEPGTVGMVTKVGYKLHDRTVRPALVGVVKASPFS